MRQLELMSKGQDPFTVEEHGHKFQMPTTEKVGGRHRKLQDRYEPILTQLTKLMMWDGKLSRAQRVGAPFTPLFQSLESTSADTHTRRPKSSY